MDEKPVWKRKSVWTASLLAVLLGGMVMADVTINDLQLLGEIAESFLRLVE